MAIQYPLDGYLLGSLNNRLEELEKHFDADAVFFYGEIHPSLVRLFRDFIEQLQGDRGADRLVIFLNTPGGSAETVEKMVEVVRYHYGEVFFVVPDYAMSAGTIFCTSGDKIFMDYSSALGPIDPQVFNGEVWVPALGYLEKVEELVEKSLRDDLSDAEFLILQGQDLAELAQYEQQRDLTVTLLKKWLVEYKFRTWDVHGTNPHKLGQPVTDDEKRERAEEVAKCLSNQELWHSHGRNIGVNTLRDVVKLRIEDYSGDDHLRKLIRSYNDLITDYIRQKGFPVFLHSRES